jgi:colanic acid/amylovoran biosynthesis glycosyltransferase
LIGTKRVQGIDLRKINSIAIQEKKSDTIYRYLFTLFGLLPKRIRELGNQNPQLIHAHFGTDAMMAVKISKKLQIPLITTFHGYDICVYPDKAEHHYHSLMNKKFDWLIEKNTLVIAVSKYIEDKLIERGVSPEKIRQHYIGIDISLFEDIKLEKKEKIILFVGRLVEKKGCEYLLKSFQLIKDKIDDYKVVIIGDGPLELELNILANTISENIIFLGSQPFSEVLNWMRKASVFCTPSIIAENGDTEALGLVFAEAQASYTPVVSFRSGGIPEVVIHNETGLLAEEKDTEQLASYLLDLASNNRKREGFARKGRLNIEKKHNLKIQSEKLELIYDEAINLGA